MFIHTKADHREQNYFCEINFRSGPPHRQLSANSNQVKKWELGEILFEWFNLGAKSFLKSFPLLSVFYGWGFLWSSVCVHKFRSNLQDLQHAYLFGHSKLTSKNDFFFSFTGTLANMIGIIQYIQGNIIIRL
jgi:hypothetical protein